MSVAVSLIDHLLVDFPFVSRADKATIFAALVQPFVRLMIRGPRPLFLIESPEAGTGKGLLADLIGIVIDGKRLPSQTLPGEDSECRKVLTSVLGSGRPVVLFDNLPEGRVISLPSLASALTSEEHIDRVLGVSVMRRASTDVLWIATGNNPRFSKELTRRTVRCRLDARVERPWMRSGFRIENLPAHVEDHRTDVIRAVLTLCQHWIASGCPHGEPKLPSLPSWCEVVGGVLKTAGIEGLLDNLEDMYSANDPGSQDWTAFFSAWWDRFRDQRLPVAELVRLCDVGGLLVDVRGGGGDRSQQTRLGRALQQAVGKTYGQHRLIAAGRDTHTKATMYRLELVGHAGSLAAGPQLDEVQHEVPHRNPAPGQGLEGSAGPAEPVPGVRGDEVP